MVEAVSNNKAHVDTIIYPLVFSARHSIELFLKAAIKSIGEARTELAVTDEKLVKTHDLNNLWKLFKDNAIRCDRRLAIGDWRLAEFVDEAEEAILDFSAIDPTAETFRYPYSQNNDKHLENTPLINMWRKLSELYSGADIDKIFNPEFQKAQSNYFHLINDSFSNEEVADLATLLELGSLNYYSEDYEYLLEGFLRENKKEQISHFMGHTAVIQYFDKSIRQLGQFSLSNVLDKYA